MADEVKVSWQGMEQLVSLTNEQYLNLSEASGFTCSGQLANTGAFSGFLSLFRGSYQDALDAVTASLDDAMTAAKALSDRIGDVRDDLRHTDHGVEVLHARLETQVECQGYSPGDGGGDVPQLPDNLVSLNNQLDVDTPMSGPPVPDFVHQHAASTPAAPLDLVDNTLSLMDDANGMGDGLDHADDADEYVHQHGGRR
ncbi:hypothetical protein ACT8ZV_04180 [Nocardioides sp. MAHUQ-72]|uniref:hypothetical protein n=1 Tax=unclassified Nocardioides TaxID=2615069 RepID=UPI003607727D